MQPTNRTVIEIWNRNAERSLVSFGEEGDFARQHLLNPAIFTLIGSVKNKRILDAGCGNGYLCRMLAQQGACVTGRRARESLLRTRAGDK